MNHVAAESEAMDPPEVTVMVVWPSVARYPLGRFLGGLYHDRRGFSVFTLGNLVALATIPLGLILYFWRVAQGVSYKLTNRRVMEMRFRDVRQAVPLGGFDAIAVEQNRGQVWYEAGDLVFSRGGEEVLRLESVHHPESFRRTCLEANLSHVAVRRVLDREVAHAG